MSKHRDQRQKMLADTLDGDWTSGPAATMAVRAAALARRRRATRQCIGVLSSVTALVVVAFFTRHFHAAEKNIPAVTESAKTPARSYTIISDQELIDSLAPLLILPDERGGRKIVLVDL
ncbi:MAG: hypothetical protein ABIZ81_03645 [Opitutaceae bacterium]